MDQLVIISIPHELCISENNINHLCDFGAKNFANILNNNLANKKIILFDGNINRSNIDLNRISSRITTEFRWNIRELLLKKIKSIILDKYPENNSRIIFVLDCHSYPPRNNNYADYNMVILLDNYNYYPLVLILKNLLTNSGINIEIMAGEHNDIIDEIYQTEQLYNLNKYNIFLIPLLLEINENLDNSQLTKISKIINYWISGINL